MFLSFFNKSGQLESLLSSWSITLDVSAAGSHYNVCVAQACTITPRSQAALTCEPILCYQLSAVGLPLLSVISQTACDVFALSFKGTVPHLREMCFFTFSFDGEIKSLLKKTNVCLA